MNRPQSWYLAIQGYQNPTRWNFRSGRTPRPTPTPTPTPTPSTKYVEILTIEDMPKNTIYNTTFSFFDIAKDVAKIEEIAFSNEVIKQFVKNPLIPDFELVQLANRILVNICLNVINNPNNPPPTEFVKRAVLVSNDGSVICDVTTYRDDNRAIELGLNLDTNAVNMNLYKNIFDTPILNDPVVIKPQPDPIYSDNMVYPPFPDVFISPMGIYFNSNNINPSLLLSNANNMMKTNELTVSFGSKSTYTYPANENNPAPTGGVATSFNVINNHGTRKEIQQAIIQDWGYSSRRSSTLQLLPNYYVAHNVKLSDGYSLTIRVSYAKYK